LNFAPGDKNQRLSGALTGSSFGIFSDFFWSWKPHHANTVKGKPLRHNS
jgi:hypothetical protein